MPTGLRLEKCGTERRLQNCHPVPLSSFITLSGVRTPPTGRRFRAGPRRDRVKRRYCLMRDSLQRRRGLLRSVNAGMFGAYQAEQSGVSRGRLAGDGNDAHEQPSFREID